MPLAFEDFARVKILSRNFIRNVSRAARTNLTQKDHNATKSLYNSFEGKDIGKSIDFYYNDYGDYQNQGIKGWRSSAKAPKSPFKYKKKMAHFGAIREWVGVRRFQFRNRKSGKFMSYESTAFLIARSVAAKGISPTRWFDDAFEKYFDKFVSDYADALVKDTEDFLIQDIQ